jgi:hypothetical protein
MMNGWMGWEMRETFGIKWRRERERERKGEFDLLLRDGT